MNLHTKTAIARRLNGGRICDTLCLLLQTVKHSRGRAREKKTRIEASFETQSECDWIVSLVLWMNCTVDGVDLCSELQKWNSHSFFKLKADRNSKAFQMIFNRKETSMAWKTIENTAGRAKVPLLIRSTNSRLVNMGENVF